MKHNRLLLLLVLLGLVLAAAPALAGTATMSQDHSLTLDFTGIPLGMYLGRCIAYVSAQSGFYFF